jgi:hypothetical protein
MTIYGWRFQGSFCGVVGHPSVFFHVWQCVGLQEVPEVGEGAR